MSPDSLAYRMIPQNIIGISDLGEEIGYEDWRIENVVCYLLVPKRMLCGHVGTVQVQKLNLIPNTGQLKGLLREKRELSRVP